MQMNTPVDPRLQFLPGTTYRPVTPTSRMVIPSPQPSSATHPPREGDNSPIAELRRRLNGTYTKPKDIDDSPPRNPKYVPIIIRSVLEQDDVHWTPPAPPQEPPVEITYADAVEVPVMPPAPSEPLERRRRIVAYDDTDPFAFPVRTIAPPSAGEGRIPFDQLTIDDLTVVHCGRRALFFDVDKVHIYIMDLDAVSDGWSLVHTKGDPPPPSCYLVPLGSGHVVALYRGANTSILDLDTMTWVSCVMQRLSLPTMPDFAHCLADDNTVYARSGSVHGTITFVSFVAALQSEAEDGSATRRWRVITKVLRSAPVEDPLVPVPGAPGIAVATTPDRRGTCLHSWIFKFEPRALNWLPYERIEVAHPYSVRLGERVLFIGSDDKGENNSLAQLRGRLGGMCLLATMDLNTGRVMHRDPSHDVRVMLQRKDVALIAPIPRLPNSMICLVADMASYLVLEFNRWEKLRRIVLNEH